MSKTSIPFGHGDTDEIVKAWLARGPIAHTDVFDYTIIRSGDGTSKINLTCWFEDGQSARGAAGRAPEPVDPGATVRLEFEREAEPARAITPPPWRSLFDARFTVDGSLARALADRNDHPLDAWIRERTAESAMERWIVQALADAYPYGGAHRREVSVAFGDNAYGDFTAAQFDDAWYAVTDANSSWSNVVTCMNFALDTWGAPGA